jgi:hypothetical protein
MHLPGPAASMTCCNCMPCFLQGAAATEYPALTATATAGSHLEVGLRPSWLGMPRSACALRAVALACKQQPLPCTSACSCSSAHF